MKKMISLLLVLVLCIACISAPAYAEDLDTPEEPIDIDEYVIQPCSGSDASDYFNGDAYIEIYVSGTVNLNDGIPIDFTCSSVSYSASSSSGSVSGYVSYRGAYISGGSVYATVYYSFDFNDGSPNSPYHESGTDAICVY